MRQVLVLVFMLTGATSLIFQVVWTRLVLLSIGTTPTAMSVVLAAFMGGMALGSIASSRWLTRYDAVRTYAWLEGWAGLYGLATPALLALVDAAPLGVQIVVATVLLLLATIAMGASLPVLSRALGEGVDRPAVTVGFLYAANTAGAVVGPLVGMFALFPLLGLHRTLVTAAIVNLAVCALLLVWRASRPSDAPQDARAEDTAHVQATVWLALAASGAAAMVYEVAWSRTLSMAFGSSIYGVSIMLSMFLLGLAAGAGLASLVLARLPRAPSPLALAWLLIGSATSAFVSLHLGRALPFTFLELFRELPDSGRGRLRHPDRVVTSADAADDPLPWRHAADGCRHCRRPVPGRAVGGSPLFGEPLRVVCGRRRRVGASRGQYWHRGVAANGRARRAPRRVRVGRPSTTLPRGDGRGYRASGHGDAHARRHAGAPRRDHRDLCGRATVSAV